MGFFFLLKPQKLFADVKVIKVKKKMDTLIQILKEPILWLLSAVVVLSYIAEQKLKVSNKK